MYRPEGMEGNPYEAKPGNAADLDRMGREIAFEVGADAMLEGLKKEEKPVIIVNEETGNVSMFLPIVPIALLQTLTEIKMGKKDASPLKLGHIT
ncbi:hypothetical protein LCGC14_1288220 [marine sediment metagenome]|uniref:Uncharacterized protein n=1 Tax=marine sediment metagenome TaxID=412755 RepID=A0A0F9N9V7_9ZZZZ